jgi:hypothetical protein
MKNIPSLTKLVVIVLFVLFISTDVSAQSTSDRQAVKEWLIANKDKVTLVSLSEYQSMSPSVKVIIDADSKSIVYAQEVKLNDIQTYESKNTATTFTAFKSDKIKSNIIEAERKAEAELLADNQRQVDKWIENNKSQNIKIISQENYRSRPQSERTYIDKLSKKIIYTGANLTIKDIVEYKEFQK